MIMNCLISYNIYHIFNMIQTSPRTKILLDIYKYKSININEYLENIYSTKIILDNRIKRFQSSNQIFVKSSNIYLYSHRSKFIKFIFNIFKIVKFF